MLKRAVVGINASSVVRRTTAALNMNDWFRGADWSPMHNRDVQHHRGSIGHPDLKPCGNDVLSVV
jgi:hypothetical protein